MFSYKIDILHLESWLWYKWLVVRGLFLQSKVEGQDVYNPRRSRVSDCNQSFSDVILLIEEASHNKLWSVWFLDQVWDFLLQVIRFLWAWLFRKCILSYYPSSSRWCILYYQYHIFIICNRVWTERLSNFTSPIILPLSNLFFLEGHSL